MNKNLEILKTIAKKSNSEVLVDKLETDGSILDVVIKRDNITVHVLFITQKDDYIAYDITSDKLPRELYSDMPREGFSDKNRSNEVLNNLELLLDRKISFTHVPKIWNRHSGYFTINIDGVPTRISQSKNHFQLPSSSNE